jgi:hypothetical protein
MGMSRKQIQHLQFMMDGDERCQGTRTPGSCINVHVAHAT